jgi:hypothetical protein
VYSSWSETEVPEEPARPGGVPPDRNDTIAGLLSEALRALRAEVEACHARCRRALESFTTSCRVDRESFRVVVESGDVVIGPPVAAPADVEVETSRRTILALIHDRLTLERAVVAGALEIKGRVAHVESLSQAMVAFLHGAVRSPSFPALLERLERLADLDQAAP